ncbi:hypothetical protein GMRT_14499 [Giardia muris]|uniref:Uncharacterized protein n=1 Tax=Giardia muris TaxID=5742 RepID=A0A4Z1STK4_GIAMU|nr:hypothetical protein GMRT_14499 [Giardia muris]|eukprot:TNJ29262.1 hypothetical protein GMRT_14499 [Giardia muris]
MNKYNTQPGPPRVLIDNWSEERTLYETTLNPDGSVKMGNCKVPTMYVQTMRPDQPMSAETTNQLYGEFRPVEHFDPATNHDYVGRPVASGIALEEKFRRQAKEEWDMYVQMRNEALDQTRERVLKDPTTLESTYAADYSCPEVKGNKSRTQPRFTNPVTLYSTGTINVRRTGPELNSFPRHAQFSTPIEENKRGQWKDD